MAGPFVFVLVGVPSFLRRKLYPQKLSPFQKETELGWFGPAYWTGQDGGDMGTGHRTPPGWLHTSRTQGHLLKLSWQRGGEKKGNEVMTKGDSGQPFQADL